MTDIATQSIRPIEPVDFEYARELGCTIRQIARASAEDNGAVFAAVRPALVPLSSGFGRVEGSQNLVTVRGIFGGETSFFGSGAGGSPTAVAVVSDVLSVAARGTARAVGDASPTAVSPGQRRFRRAALRAVHGQRQARHPGAGHDRVRASYGINIEGVLQLPKFRKDRLPFVTTLEECSESVLDRALAEVAKSDYPRAAAALAADLRADMMPKQSSVHSEVVEAEGHLIDSQILNVVFDTVVKHDASFDVLKFNIGRSNDEPSSISMRISAPTEQTLGAGARGAGGARLPARRHSRTRQLRAADRDGCVPDDFYSTTNHRTLVRHERAVDRGRAPADGRGDRHRRRRARRAASCATSGRATRSSAASTAFA